jgi:hypothetical protein
VQNYKKAIIFFIILSVVGGAFLIRGWKIRQGEESVGAKVSGESGTKKIETTYQSLNGALIANEQLVSQAPLAVVIENYPDARPQSGLSKADLVYETVAEGGITRFLAVYQTQKAESIGPIRSARTYFAEIADELGAVFAHVGGNSDVLENLKQNMYSKLMNLDQFFQERYFHRVSSRPMPHNVYSSTEKLFSYFLDSKKLAGKKYGEWLYTGQFLGLESAEKVDIDFSTIDYGVSYVYDSNLAAYERFLAGKPHLDAEGKSKILVKNVVVQSVRTWPVKTDTPFSISMDLSAGGPAYVFAQGKAIIGTWRKASGERTRYYDGAGKEIELLRGVTWVELVPEEKIGELKWASRKKID